MAAGVLRFYWFRLADIAVPLATSIAAIYFISQRANQSRPWTVPAWILIGLLPGSLLVAMSIARFQHPCPPSESKLANYVHWQDACNWIRNHTPTDSIFLVPRAGQTFKWHAQRSDVANWKDVPQDAENIMVWRNRFFNIFYGPDILHPRGNKAFRSLALVGTPRLRELAQQYQANYVITVPQPPLDFPIVYANETYAVYKIEK
jgi:hypothetical protein